MGLQGENRCSRSCSEAQGKVAQGYTQEFGVDYEEIFASVVRQTRTLLAVARKQKLTIHYDVKNAFLNGVLEETIYMSQPKGYEVKNKKHGM